MKRLLLVLSLAAGCTDVFAPQAPAPFLTGAAAPLVFTATVSKPIVQVGDTASLIFTLRNPSSDRVTLTFSSGCQVTGFVKRGREVVWPKSQICPASITYIVLQPGQQKVVT